VDFSLSDEQRLLIDTVRRFIAEQLAPLEDEVERAGTIEPAVARAIFEKSKALGLYGMNMPTSLGGGAKCSTANGASRSLPRLRN
jgi:acyl-CoA dehydrogenase